MLPSAPSTDIIQRQGPRGSTAPIHAPPRPIHLAGLLQSRLAHTSTEPSRPLGVLELVARAPAQVPGTQ